MVALVSVQGHTAAKQFMMRLGVGSNKQWDPQL